MKKIDLFSLIVISIFSINCLFAANKDGRIMMYARLSAAQEVPKVNNQAKGLVTFTLEEDYKTLTIYGVFDSLSGPVTNCHFHTGGFGVNGAVVLNLLPLVKGNQISGQVTVTKAILAAINGYGIYINVHTAANPGGEMRGQISYESDLHFVSVMTGGGEVPAVSTNALGLGSFVSSALNKLEYKVLVTGLSGPITGAHIHFGGAGRVGPIAYPLTFSGNTLTGFLDVTNAFKDSLYSALTYINIHTAANPNGEIRAQIGFATQVAFDAYATGDNEVPATTSTGKALAIGWMSPELDSMNYLAIYDGIVPTNAHFHTGLAGANGAVIYTFTTLAGVNGYMGRVGIKPDTLSKILRGGIYLNLHTAANPNGEIRGQSFTSVREGLVANLCGKQEVPTVNGTAIGVGMLSIDRNKTNGHAELLTTGLTSNAISGHIHLGAKGVAGGVYVNLGVTGASGNGAAGEFQIARTTLADSLINGLSYYNVHTAANPNGEIRGQINKTTQSECLPVGIYELNGEKLSVKVFPNPMADVVNLDFDSNDAFAAQIVVSDLLGRTMSSKSVGILRGANQMVLPVDGLSRGIYFIQLRNNSRILFTEKVVKD